MKKAIKRFASRLTRLRKRKGYGVHSPFAYNFIEDVVYGHGRYYAYRRLRQLRRQHCGGDFCLSAKGDRLMFRLANFCRPARAWLVGQGSAVTAEYISAGSNSCAVSACADAASLPIGASGMVFAARGAGIAATYGAVASGAAQDTVLVFSGIHASREAREEWRQVCADSRSVVTFDLYELGIVFFDRRLNKQDYKVSF